MTDEQLKQRLLEAGYLLVARESVEELGRVRDDLARVGVRALDDLDLVIADLKRGVW